jgi:diacylglycerol O-acyltransferase / wax synthase
VSLRRADDSSMNNQVSGIRVDLATDIAGLPERFKAIHASSEAAKAVVRELKPVLGVDMPVTGAPWLMTGLASLYGRSKLARRLPPVGNVLISNVPGPAMPLYMAGARMTHYYPVSIPYHGMALNITVQSYAGSLEFGLTACRRVLSQEESYEIVGYLRDALEDIRRLPSVAQDAEPAAATATPLIEPAEPVTATRKKTARAKSELPAAKTRGAGNAVARRMH